MKITYIHQHFSLPSEASGSRPYEFARRMAADGHEVTMICGGAEPMDTVVEGIHVKRLSIPYRNAMSVPERLWSFARFMVAASVAAARTKADVIFASSTPLTVAVPGIVGKLFRRVPMVFEVRDLWPSVPIELGYLRNPVAVWLARALEKIAYRSADHVVALSPGMRDGVLEVNSKADVTVIPNACDFEVFDKNEEERRAFRDSQGWADDETVIVYAGGFGPVYQLDWVTRLAAEVQQDKIRFILIGEGADSEKLHALATELGLDPAQVLPGRKPRTEVASFYSAGDLVLSPMRPEPSLEAASINKIFDGMAAGRPVAANHGGWLTEAILESGAGWKLARSLDTAADQLRSIAGDPAAMESAGLNSAALGRERFERNKLYRQLIDVLDAAAEKGASVSR